jgi:DNA helicase-2/ATP-dependent DNA helicase PcrA
MTDYSTLLNPEQCAAATATDGPLLVLAAAGTGKTRTLVYRVAHLIEKGVPADSLLLLTFTNRAASEMLERAKAVAGPSVGHLWSGTFHHVCNRFLRRFSDRLGYQNNFAILDQDDALSVLNTCMKELGFARKDFPKKEIIASLISSATNRMLSLTEYLDSCSKALDANPADILRIAQRYAERKLTENMMDFDDMLVNGLRLLQEHEDIRTYYQQKFRHVLVDEYQDTNILQALMVDILAGHHRNIMAVGDDMQCIYTWRGADFNNIREFSKRWPDCRIIKIEQNYRSTPDILRIANACAAKAPQEFKKTLRSTRPARNKPRVLILRDGDEQSRAIISMVQHYLDDGYSLSDMAILYRAHFHSIELQMALARTRLPYVITSGLGVFEQAHVKDVLAFLRVCENPRDYLAFTRLMGMLAGVGEKTVEALWSKLGGSFETRSPEMRAKLVSLLKPAARGQWQGIDRLFADYHAEGLNMRGTEAIERFCETFYNTYLHRAYENPEKREEDIHELALQVTKSKGGVAAFLQEVALLTNIDREYEKMEANNEPTLHLSTVHQAKGLEWKIVFMIWVSEGMFPSSRSLEETGSDEEERRLFYVAVTRAKDELILCSPGMRKMRDGGMFFCKPSPFVKEIPRECIRESFGIR